MHPRIQQSLTSLVLVLASLTLSSCGDDDETAPPATNTPPTLTGPTTSVGQAAPGDAIPLTLAATDPDGDSLTYAWSQTPATPAGAFSSTTVANPTWTAPTVSSTQRFTLAVVVTDGKGGSVQSSVDVSVAQQNRAPTVAATITAPATLLAGTPGAFSITASDEDGDPLTYAWEQEAPATQGTWVGGLTGSSAEWYSPPVGTQTSFTLKVSVTDGNSAPVVRTVTVPVTVPRYATDIQPVWSVCTSCHGGSGGLNLAAGSSHGNLVNVNANNAACNTLKRVTPSEPGDSVLVRKMEGTACGNRMPRNNPTYFNTNPGLIVRVRSWILAGAAND